MENDLEEKLAEFVRAERKMKGWSQEMLGEIAGTTQDKISTIETGRHKTTLTEYAKILDALGVDLSGWLESRINTGLALRDFLADPRSRRLTHAELDALRALDRLDALGDEKDIAAKLLILLEWADRDEQPENAGGGTGRATLKQDA